VGSGKWEVGSGKRGAGESGERKRASRNSEPQCELKKEAEEKGKIVCITFLDLRYSTVLKISNFEQWTGGRPFPFAA
jgi:hypothetical protein